MALVISAFCCSSVTDDRSQGLSYLSATSPPCARRSLQHVMARAHMRCLDTGMKHRRTAPIGRGLMCLNAPAGRSVEDRYSSDWIALSSRKRIAPSLFVCDITKRTRPYLEVSA